MPLGVVRGHAYPKTPQKTSLRKSPRISCSLKRSARPEASMSAHLPRMSQYASARPGNRNDFSCGRSASGRKSGFASTGKEVLPGARAGRGCPARLPAAEDHRSRVGKVLQAAEISGNRPSKPGRGSERGRSRNGNAPSCFHGSVPLRPRARKRIATPAGYPPGELVRIPYKLPLPRFRSPACHFGRPGRRARAKTCQNVRHRGDSLPRRTADVRIFQRLARELLSHDNICKHSVALDEG